MKKNRISKHRRRRLVPTACLLALLGLSTVIVGGRPAQVLGAEEPWQQIALIYHSDGKGKIEPCG